MRSRVIARIIVVALAVLTALAADSAYASRDLDPEVLISLSTPAEGTPADLIIDLEVPSDSVMPRGFSVWLPPEWNMNPGSEVAIGSETARILNQSALGIINSACFTTLPIEVMLYNSTVDPETTVALGDDDDDQTPDYAEDEDGNGLIDVIDLYPDYLIDQYPSPLKVRAAGVVPVAGLPILFQVIVTEDEVFQSRDRLDISFRYPGDTLSPMTPIAITDWCTPIETSLTLFGETESGQDILLNPAAGEYQFDFEITPEPDADDDGWENIVDTCKLAPNVGSPLISNSGDADNDGVDAACDPNDDPSSGGSNSDIDDDGFINRGDNCPLVANGNELASDMRQLDTDADGIGDACDPNPKDVDGGGASVTGDVSVTINTSVRRSGDVDCNGVADEQDALKILADRAGVDVDLPLNCPDIGSVLP